MRHKHCGALFWSRVQPWRVRAAAMFRAVMQPRLLSRYAAPAEHLSHTTPCVAWRFRHPAPGRPSQNVNNGGNATDIDPGNLSNAARRVKRVDDPTSDKTHWHTISAGPRPHFTARTGRGNDRCRLTLPLRSVSIKKQKGCAPETG